MPGYVKKEGQEYCQRCFRLTHYGERRELGTRFVKNKDIYEIYDSYKGEVIALVIDVFEALFSDVDKLLETFKGHKILCVFSKADLLPEESDPEIIVRKLRKVAEEASKKGTEVIDILLTSIKDENFPEFFREVIESHEIHRIVFAGRANAGKSSIINLLLGSDELTISRYPGTTLAANEIEKDGYTFIDTPGLFDKENILAYVPFEKTEEVALRESVKPKNFQVYDEQSYFIEGLLRIDVFPEKRSTLVIYVNPMLDIHRTKYSNADSYYENNKRSIPLKFDRYGTFTETYSGSQTYYVKGLGLFRIVGEGEIAISTYDKMKVYRSEVFI